MMSDDTISPSQGLEVRCDPLEISNSSTGVNFDSFLKSNTSESWSLYNLLFPAEENHDEFECSADSFLVANGEDLENLNRFCVGEPALPAYVDIKHVGLNQDNAIEDDTNSSSSSSPQTVPEMLKCSESVGSPSEDVPSSLLNLDSLPKTTYADSGTETSSELLGNSCCNLEIKETVLRMQSKIHMFTSLVKDLQVTLGSLRNAVKYLPVPPSPTIIDEPRNENIPTYDYKYEDGKCSSEGEPIPHHRRLFLQDSGSDADHAIVLDSEEWPMASGESNTNTVKETRSLEDIDCSNLIATPELVLIKPEEPATNEEIGNVEKVSKENEHSPSNPDVPQFACSCCSSVYYSEQQLKRHQRDRDHYDPTSTYLCPICPMRLGSLRSSKMHEKRHANPKRWIYKCTDCDLIFAFKGQLNRHRICHENDIKPSGTNANMELEKDAKCHNAYDNKSERANQFLSKGEMKKNGNGRKNSNKRSWTKTRGELVTDGKRHAGDNNTKENNVGHSSLRFRCNLCSKWYSSEKNLWTHRNIDGCWTKNTKGTLMDVNVKCNNNDTIPSRLFRNSLDCKEFATAAEPKNEEQYEENSDTSSWTKASGELETDEKCHAGDYDNDTTASSTLMDVDVKCTNDGSGPSRDFVSNVDVDSKTCASAAEVKKDENCEDDSDKSSSNQKIEEEDDKCLKNPFRCRFCSKEFVTIGEVDAHEEKHSERDRRALLRSQRLRK